MNTLLTVYLKYYFDIFRRWIYQLFEFNLRISQISSSKMDGSKDGLFVTFDGLEYVSRIERKPRISEFIKNVILVISGLTAHKEHYFWHKSGSKLAQTCQKYAKTCNIIKYYVPVINIHTCSDLNKVIQFECLEVDYLIN